MNEAARSVEPEEVAWRRDIHQHPELGNRDSRTGGLVAEHLRSLGLEVRTEVAGGGRVVERRLSTGAEDFSYFQREVPGLFFNLGVTPLDQDPAAVPRNHSPPFFADEAALLVGVRAMAHLAIDFLSSR